MSLKPKFDDSSHHSPEMQMAGQLVRAIRDRSYTAVAQILVRETLDLSKLDRLFARPLMYEAVLEGNRDIAELLLSYGADVNARLAGGETPLHLAVSSRMPAMVSLLLAADADVNRATSEGITPLHLAAHAGDAMIARLLVTASADVDAAAKNGKTALAIAAQRGNFDCAEYLLQVKSRPFQPDWDARLPTITLADLRRPLPPSGRMGLVAAAKSGRFAEIVAAALRNGSDGDRLSFIDAVRKDRDSKTVLQTLGGQGQLALLFRPAFWQDNLADLQKLRGEVPQAWQGQVDWEEVFCKINLHILLKRAQDKRQKFRWQRKKP